MPIVNRSNYAACPSCGKWMHKLAIADYLHNADDVVIGNLKGNRAHICQKCYERADAQPMQADQNEEVKRKVAEQAKPFDTPVTRADLGKELDPLRDVSNKEVDEFCAFFPHRPFGGLDVLYALHAFIARRRSP